MTTEQVPVKATVWVLLWSKSQCATHVEPLKDMLDNNLRAYQADRRMDFVPLAIGSEADVRHAATEIRPTMRDRQKQRQGAL